MANLFTLGLKSNLRMPSCGTSLTPLDSRPMTAPPLCIYWVVTEQVPQGDPV
ncbi:MAG: hypothetical protein NTX38_00465 [Methylobacter sp.]|nr:hypothetical protein [Methylobacter sp.]